MDIQDQYISEGQWDFELHIINDRSPIYLSFEQQVSQSIIDLLI